MANSDRSVPIRFLQNKMMNKEGRKLTGDLAGILEKGLRRQQTTERGRGCCGRLDEKSYSSMFALG